MNIILCAALDRDLPDQSVTLEKSLGVLVFQLEQFTSSTTNFRQGQGNAPNFALVLETVFTG